MTSATKQSKNNENVLFTLDKDDQIFIDRLRGLSIIRVVLVHLGLSWFYPPYSQFVLVLLPILFFVSGAVSLPIFLRASNSLHYAVKRVSSVVIPYYTITAFIIIFTLVFFSSHYSMNTTTAIRWLFVSPTSEMTPFSLGQVWFIRALLVISLISIPVYLLSRININYLLLPILLSVIVGFYQTYHNINEFFYAGFFNLYQPTVNAGFFFFGSYYYANKSKMGPKIISLMLVAALALSFFAFQDAALTINMSDHAFAPNLYYLGLSYAAIFLVILIKPIIQKLILAFKNIDRLVVAYSKHAYSVFIMHSAMIYLTEAVFGWKDVREEPMFALAKIVVVLFGSLLISIPITKVTRAASKGLVEQFYGR